MRMLSFNNAGLIVQDIIKLQEEVKKPILLN